jgi:hypothetical protein
MPQELLSLRDFENKITDDFGCWRTFYMNDLLFGSNIVECTSANQYNFDYEQLVTIHHKNTINLFLPNVNIRCTCTKSFALNILPIKTIIDGEWDKKNVFKSIYKKESGEMYEGAINLIVENELESLIFSKKIMVNRTSYHPRMMVTTKEVATNNLFEFIDETYKEYHYRDTFNNYVHNSEDD